METKKLIYPKPNEHYNNCLFDVNVNTTDFQMGTVFLKKGTRIPEKGFTKHERHEISIVQEGKIEMLKEDGTVLGILKKGDVVYIPALEAQAGNVIEDTKIIYTLIK